MLKTQQSRSTATTTPQSEQQLETVQIVRVSDGDTVKLSDGRRIRFCGIDAPEKQQPLGRASTQLLKQLTGDGRVQLRAIETDRYKRTVAELFTVTGRSINAEMVRAGMAYHYARYSKNCPSRSAIISAEQYAKSRRLGVWKGINVKPWNFRKQSRR